MSEIKFLIPENLDIDAIEKEHQECFKVNKIRKPQVLYILHQLIESRLLRRKQMDDEESDFTPLSSVLLHDVVHNYKDCLDFLLSTGILISDERYIKGEKCKGYAYSHPYNGNKLKEAPASS